MHSLALHNGHIIDAGDAVLRSGQVGLLNGWGVFSTLRVWDGVLFAWDRHWARMSRDAALLRVPMPDKGALHRQLTTLVEANRAANATLRVVIIRNRGGMWQGPAPAPEFDTVAFTTDLKDWGTGCNLGVVEHARHAASPFAGTKMLSWSFNLTWLEQAQEQGLDEVVLLNEYGRVSECTSANIFLSADGGIVTPPLSEGCLPGITREILLELSTPDLPVTERPLTLDDLWSADSVFITSSTRELLPVRSVGGKPAGANDTARARLHEAFLRYARDYVAGRRSAG